MFIKLNQKMAPVLALLAAVGLSACGGGSGNGSTNPAIAGVGGYSSYGAPGCSRVDAPIAFQITNAYTDSANVVGGELPYGRRGVSAVTGQGINGNYTSDWNSGYGQITMAIQSGLGFGNSLPYSGYPQYTYGCPSGGCGMPGSPYQATLYGTIWLGNTTILQKIIDEASLYQGGGIYSYGQQGFFQYPGRGGYMPLNQYAQYNVPCVSKVAVNLGKIDPGGIRGGAGHLYGGEVFLYMNNTLSGYVLHY